ncbi:hypothetical protein N752_02955 [Desulforamulus aquiferis]|nr:aminotransferase class I/II-fold pyridoxal phosphate-dependent enzyme [Desulforamulus aquiferis]RYD06646.1 hypothetical protein N752_02955 [Desulforamulus aquiferis]
MVDTRQLAEIVQTGDLVVICNPNNPTGQLVDRNNLIALSERIRDVGASLLIDEAFMDFVVPEQSLLEEVKQNSSLFVLRSLTKIFAIPGLRLGYLVANSNMIKLLTEVLPPWRVNIIAQEAGLASLADQQYLNSTLELISSQKEYLYHGLKSIPGLYPFHPKANFILIDASESGLTGKEIQSLLGPRGILIRQCDNFSGLGPNYFRVAVRTERENKILINNLKGFITPSR